MMRNLLRGLCRNAALADYSAQETFLQAWIHLKGLRAPEAFEGWLRTMATNSWRQYRRREGATELEQLLS
jgi:DNA-directed RNA polymerase specialized sigma24 family protein